jgi:scyllo-inositol 2-dehydrogenase (NADP+)
VEQLWTEVSVDLVVICTPSGTHAAHATAALDAGRHLVVEKPFARTADEARAIAARARAAGRLAIPFQNRRWDGDFLTVRQLVADGVLGELHRFESRFERWRAQPRPRWCEPGARDAAEGIVYDIGSHLVDQALQLLGPVRHVYAELARVREAVQVEDDAFVALTHESGVRSHLYMSASAAAPGARFTLSGRRGAYVKHGLDGQEAALGQGADPRAPGWSSEPPSAWGSLAGEQASRIVPTAPGAYDSFYPRVRDAIVRGAPSPVMVEEAIAALEVIEAIFASDAAGVGVAVGPRG